jgi:tRNA (guanine10-N2)-dimethyltransferase
MGEHIVALRGWHPALAQAEVRALFPGRNIQPFASPRLMQLQLNEEDLPNISISSGIEAIFNNGENHLFNNVESIRSIIKSHLELNPPNDEACAVVAWKHGRGIEGVSRSAFAGRIGGILSSMGAKIDLEHPKQRFGILLDQHSNSVTFGWLQGMGPSGDGSVERRASQRPFFKPVSLEPRLARLAVNLASGPLQKGPTLDPMTGTGGFAIEAVLSGRNVVALDLDAEMIEGAKKNLEWSGTTTDVFFQGDATAISESIPINGPQSFSGVVLDPPYGRNSQGSLDHKELLKQTLLSCSKVVDDGSLVLILPSEARELCLESTLSAEERPELIHFQWPELERLLLDCNWKYEDAWYVFVHGSLGRVVIYASIVPQD